MLDTLVVGAGPGGVACALGLHRAGVRVSLLEGSPPREFLLGEAATPDVPGLLRAVGLEPPAARPILGQIAAWGARTTVEDFAQRGAPPGLRLDRAAFQEQLIAAAAGAGLLQPRPGRLCGVARGPNGWIVQVEGGGELETRVLVDATGRSSAVARALGARRQPVDRQVALARRVPAALLAPLGPRVLVTTAPEGWWYASAGHDDGLLCLFTDADLCRTLRDPLGWAAALRRCPAVVERLAGTLDPAPPTLADASSACLDRAAGPGWVALGDALLSLDPLTSSGISGALRDAAHVVESLLVPWLAGADPAPPARAWAARANRAWARFLRERAAHYAVVEVDGPYWARRRPSIPGSVEHPLP